jgi:hypothetical protein
MVTHKKHNPHVTLIALAKLLPLRPRNLAIFTIESPQVHTETNVTETVPLVLVVGNSEPCCDLLTVRT